MKENFVHQSKEILAMNEKKKGIASLWEDHVKQEEGEKSIERWECLWKVQIFEKKIIDIQSWDSNDNCEFVNRFYEFVNKLVIQFTKFVIVIRVLPQISYTRC